MRAFKKIGKFARMFVLVVMAALAVMLFGTNVNAATGQIALRLPDCAFASAEVTGTAHQGERVVVRAIVDDTVRVVAVQDVEEDGLVNFTTPPAPIGVEVTYVVTITPGLDDSIAQQGVQPVPVVWGAATRPAETCDVPPAVG